MAQGMLLNILQWPIWEKESKKEVIHTHMKQRNIWPWADLK